MLFDLRSGKRRRVVQVVYSLLAASFLIGFVFFGVGSGGIGSFSDLLGSGGSGGSVSSQFDDQIDAANQELAKNPKDTDALKKLALNEYLKGRQGVTQDPTTGGFSVSSEAHDELGKAADAWSKYLRLNDGKPDAGVAAQIVTAFYFLNDFAGAAKTQKIVAQNEPSAGAYNQLAFFEYASFDMAAGDAAARKAESQASGAERQQVKAQLASIRKRAVKLKKKLAEASENAPAPTTPGASPLQSPLGGTGTP